MSHTSPVPWLSRPTIRKPDGDCAVGRSRDCTNEAAERDDIRIEAPVSGPLADD